MSDSISNEFDSLQLGDKRLDKRCKSIAQRFAANPQASINAASQGWNETHAAYEFFNNDQVEEEVAFTETGLCFGVMDVKLFSNAPETLGHKGDRRKQLPIEEKEHPTPADFVSRAKQPRSTPQRDADAGPSDNGGSCEASDHQAAAHATSFSAGSGVVGRRSPRGRRSR